MSWKLCFKREGAFKITLEQYGRTAQFRVRYGFQEWIGDRDFAAHRLGEALMHCLECEGSVETGE